MTNLQAAIGLAQTERLHGPGRAPPANAARYRRRSRACPASTCRWRRTDVRSVVLDGRPHRRTTTSGAPATSCASRLAARGHRARTYFVPMHLQPAYFRAHRGEQYPVAEELGRTGLYLPSRSGPHRRRHRLRGPRGPPGALGDRARAAPAAARSPARTRLTSRAADTRSTSGPRAAATAAGYRPTLVAVAPSGGSYEAAVRHRPTAPPRRCGRSASSTSRSSSARCARPSSSSPPTGRTCPRPRLRGVGGRGGVRGCRAPGRGGPGGCRRQLVHRVPGRARVAGARCRR